MNTDRKLGPLPSKYWIDTFRESAAPDVVAWKLARAAIEHENSLVNHRMTWFLGIQAFLFSAFVLIFVTWYKDEGKLGSFLIPPLLAAVGLFAGYVCLITDDGLKRAFLATEKVTLQYRRLCLAHPPDPIVPPLHYWVRPSPANLQWLARSTMILWLAIVLSCIAFISPDLRKFLMNLSVEQVLIVLFALFAFGLGFAVRGSRMLRKLDLSNDPSFAESRDEYR
jgi:hypothetical protein